MHHQTIQDVHTSEASRPSRTASAHWAPNAVTWHWSLFWRYLTTPLILQGAFTTIWLTVATMVGAVLFGLLFALANDRGNAVVRLLYWLYITLIRGTPLLLQLVFVYTVLPLAGVKLGVAEAALLALVVNEVAYIAEIIRSGLDAIPVGQREAAHASGFGRWQTEFLVVVPQAVRIVVPTIGNQVNAMFKYTSLVSVISMTELFQATQEIADATFQFLEIYAVAALYYLAMTFVWTLVQSRIERATAIPGSHAAQRRSNPLRDIAMRVASRASR